MVNSVSSSSSDTPVKTLQMFDPAQKKVRKFTNNTEVIDKYMTATNKATKRMFSDAIFASITGGILGVSGRLLYDGIKRGKFYTTKTVAIGLFGAITGFLAVAGLIYKTRVKKITELFINNSEKSFPLENNFNVKPSDYGKSVPEIKETQP